MSITSISNESSNSAFTDETRAKSREKNIFKDFDFILSSFKKNLNNNIFNLKEMIKNNVNSYKKQDFEKIIMIINQIEILFNRYINDISSCYIGKYENILRAYEQKIRVLYENKFNLELKKRILEESNFNLLKKEKEYELIKKKTGIIIQNGKIINNNRKENEILILKKENSILKDTIEKQRLDILLKGKTIQQKNAQLNKKLILKLNLKNKARQKNLSHHSHPKSNPHFKPDFISKLNNSILKYKSIISQKSFLNKSFSNNFNTDNININYSQKKNKTIRNNADIRTKKISSKNINNKKQNLKVCKKIINKKNNSLNPSLVGTNITGVTKDASSNGYTPEFKNRNYSEYFNNKKEHLLMIKTLNNDPNYNRKKKINRFLSPVNGQNNKLLPKVKYSLIKIKYSHSFTSKNNLNNMNLQNNKQGSEKVQNKNIKKIILPKNESNKINKNMLLIKKKIDSNSKTKISGEQKKKSNANSKRKKNNNIHIVNEKNNNFVKKKKKIN